MHTPLRHIYLIIFIRTTFMNSFFNLYIQNDIFFNVKERIHVNGVVVLIAESWLVLLVDQL